ncbi:serine/threonine-protein kinase [Streptomyces beigongshangae]|uniref:serine/threonine-protein kinase n=1 Tax=Streptomyces beigongshangae TaxID=2841597 RepID=UPI0021A7133B|nr:serine/threonine-protein kinase [Streptomyces sp. REN17]
MGEVWQATDEVLGRSVAVKLLLGDEADSASSARFRLEAQTAARLSHPYVVAVFDFGAWEDRFYLVMELVEGRSLAQELTASGTLGPERVATVAAQAAAGLAAAHREGIVHRDIKPGNLLSDAHGTVKIGDFGIARFVDDPSSALTTAGQIVGTSLYLAPERALGRPASASSDVYSLGCVLYQLLTGRPPFQGESATVTLHQHIDMAPVPPREHGVRLPPAFENYLLGLLAKQPEDRPTAQEVADWFASGAWRGRAEPLPVAAPRQPGTQGTPGTQRAQRAQGSYGTAPPRSGAADSGAPTTYRLPSAAAQPTGRAAARAARSDTSSHAARPGPSRRARPAGSGRGGGVGTAVRRRPRVFGVLAGAVLFVLAVFAGMSMFAPDTTGTKTGPSGTAPSASPAGGTSGRSSDDSSDESSNGSASGEPVAGTAAGAGDGRNQESGTTSGAGPAQDPATAPDPAANGDGPRKKEGEKAEKRDPAGNAGGGGGDEENEGDEGGEGEEEDEG